MTTDQYFANYSARDLCPEVMHRVETYDNFLQQTNLIYLWRRSADYYYRGVNESTLTECGEQREFLKVFVGHYRNILRHIFISTVGTRPAFEPRATNTEYKARAQVQSCNGLLDYYFEDKQMEASLDRVAEGAILFGEYFWLPEWDIMAGDATGLEPVMDPKTGEPEIDPTTGILRERITYPGDIAVTSFSPIDVIRDPLKKQFSDQRWLIVRRRINRWELIARYPQYASEILASYDNKREREENSISPFKNKWSNYEQNDDEDVTVYVFYHKKTPAVPLGRVTMVLDDQTALFDSSFEELKYPTADFPLVRMTTGDMHDAPFGYTFAYDLLALQDFVNLLYSTIATNVGAFGVQSMQAMKGSGVEVSQIATGLRLILFDNPNGKLEPLQLPGTPAEVYNLIDVVEKVIETISGVNSVARGNPEASLKSGAALALVQAQHLEFTRDHLMAFGQLVSQGGTAVVRLFKQHADNPRLAAIAGKTGRTYLKQLQGSDLDLIDCVKVDMGNHLAKTAAGRLNIAEQLVQNGFIETADQYMSVLSTGRLEPVTHSKQATLDLIQAENEQIRDGINPKVLLTDNHPLHIMEHNVVGADVEARKDQPTMDALTAHLMEHLNQLRTLPPELAALLRLPTGASMPAPGGAPGQGGAPGTAPPPPPDNAVGPAAAGAALPSEAPDMNGGGEVAFPKNALTGETYQPQGLQ